MRFCGLALYYKENIFKPTIEVKEDTIQITKMEATNLEVITVYKSEKANVSVLLEHLKTMIKPGIPTVVQGDFNMCYLSNKYNKVTKYLENEGFRQLMHEATHMKGRIIDHIYFRTDDNNSEAASIYRYSPYYSDHDAICTTLVTA